MNPQDIQQQATSNVPTTPVAAPTVAPIASPQSAPAPAVSGGSAFANQLATASQARFQSMATAMQQAGYIYNPTTGTFIQNQAYLNPLQQAQYQTTYTPQGADYLAQLQATAKAGAAGSNPVDPNELDNFVNAQGQTPDNPNLTLSQLQQAGYKYVSSGDKNAIDALNQGYSLLNQISNASKEINTMSGMGGANNSNFLQMIKGGFENLVGNTAARNLSEILPAQLSSVVQALGGSQRFNPAQISKLEAAIPRPTDTTEQAANKLSALKTTLDQVKSELLPQSPNGSVTGNQTSLNSIFGQ